ncbi:intermembrane lipid transfer protein VPS13B-like [Clavelina lepadiformis]|uniref:intermembrane lipid transfer protein VPS13B-like n=1 Tax=Clavelina lepadiformis TaxID=159417 RepID=UPI004042960C
MNMLRLESYLSPFLLTYLSKYIKDLESKNLQLSLWGGDAVLHNLQFNLDALDEELGGAPFSFVSCQANELRIHVPWSKLASESVVVTLDTVECVVKLHCHKPQKKKSPIQENQDVTKKQPSYVDSLITKIKNNLTIQINNLTLKYVEDDIVLSVNVQSTAYQAVDGTWTPAFIELTESSPTLRHVCELKDTTVCLDKRGASGLVDSFEDPLIFRCHFVFRIHAMYPTHTSRKPSATKVNLMVERYELNISEKQLPAVLHLLELCLHIYYGTIDCATPEEIGHQEDVKPDDSQGWVSWAWSYVPPVMSYDVDENVVKNPIFAFSIYVKTLVIQFKPSKAETAKLFHRTQNASMKALIKMSGESLSIELVSRGLDFFSCEVFLCSGSITFEGGTPAKVNGKVIPNHRGDESLLLASCVGSPVGFAANSLFDFRSPENNDAPFEYVLTREEFFSEKGRHDTYAFCSQYLYIAEDKRQETEREEVEFNGYLRNADLTNTDEWRNFHERSWKRFIVGGESCHFTLSSHTLMCVDILLAWAKDHALKPYPLAERPTIHPPEVLKDVNFVPNRSATFLLKNLHFTFQALSLQPNTYKEKTFNCVDLLSRGFSTHIKAHSEKKKAMLPALVVSLPSVRISSNQPMYADHFAAYLSCFVSPLPKLMEKCNVKYTLEVKSIDIFVWLCNVLHEDTFHPPPNVKSVARVKDIILEHHALLATSYWHKRLTMIKSQTKSLVHSLKLDAMPFQLEMFTHVLDSWLNLLKHDSIVYEVLDVSLLREKFLTRDSPSLKVALRSVVAEVTKTFATSSLCGALKSFDVHWSLSEDEIVPLVQCSHIYEKVYLKDNLTSQQNVISHANKSAERSLEWKEDSHWLSFYFQIPNENKGDGCVLVNFHQLFVILDSTILNTLSRFPEITLKQLLPFLMTPMQKNSSNSTTENTATIFTNLKSKYAVQCKCSGVHLFVSLNQLSVLPLDYRSLLYTQIVRQCTLKAKEGDILCLSFPEIKAFTSGFKTVKIMPELLQKGVQVNKFTDFATLNFVLEHASIYTGLTTSDMYRILYIATPGTATCTLVLKQPASKDLKLNISMHLDIEPVSLKISKHQTEFLVKLLHKFENVGNNILENCITPTNILPVVPLSKEYMRKVPRKLSHPQEVHNPNIQDDTKSNQSALESVALPKGMWFTLWLQCTLPRFSLDVYPSSPTSTPSKLAFSIEDISLSLDSQPVYLKLMSSCTRCSLTYWEKEEKMWRKTVLSGLMLSPMFEVLPSFIQKYDAPKNKPPHAPEVSTKHGKFFDVTFTQALTSDYQRHVHEESQESIETGNSSVVTTNSDSIAKVKRNISELICSIQACDLVINPKVAIGVLQVFMPLIQSFSHVSGETTATSRPFDLPVLYFNLGGGRLFLPCTKQRFSKSHDDVLMACFSSFEVNPQPQNPLTRLVLAPSIYRRANAAGLLQCVGSSLQDKQFEINIQDISVGSANRGDIVAYLKRPAPCENPALQWNMQCEVLAMPEPAFHPIIEQLDVQSTIAPSILHWNSLNRRIPICAPSLELNVTTDIIFHFTIAQFQLLLDAANIWSLKDLEFSKVSPVSTPAKETLTIGKLPQQDSGFSVCELSVSDKTSEKPILSTNAKLMGDLLVTGQNVKILVYQFCDNDMVKPLSSIIINEPSFVAHVSKHQQKLEVQFHNASINVAEGVKEPSFTIHDHGNFPNKFFDTQHGDCNPRTGVPTSLCTMTVNHFLTKKASLTATIGRPIKVILNENAVNIFEEIITGAQNINLPSHEFDPVVTKEQGDSMQKLSFLVLNCSQVLGELQCSNIAMRCAMSSGRCELQVKDKSISCDVALNNISLRLKSSADFVPILHPITLNVGLESSTLSQGDLCLHKTTIKASAIKIMVYTDIMHSVNCVLMSIQEWMNRLSKANNKDSNNNSSNLEMVTPSSHLHLAYADDLRKGGFAYVTANNNQEPLSNQIVFSSSLPDSSMAWCYDKPHAVKQVCITPIPFNEILGDHSEIKCMLESFSESSGLYECQKIFYLSETRHVNFTLFDDETPFHKVVSSAKWRVTVHNTDVCHVSPLSLAASMEVESVFDSRIVPTITVTLVLPRVNATAVAKQGTELLCVNLSDVNTFVQYWLDTTKQYTVDTNLTVAADIVEAHNLTWLPALQPTPISFSLMQKDDLLSVDCNLNDITELRVSQCCIHSVQHLISSFTDDGSHAEENFLKLSLENQTGKTLLYGQALTDECLSLKPKSKTSYSWRCSKTDPKLHISVEGLPDWNWSDNFYPGCTCRFLCPISKLCSVIVSVDCTPKWNTLVAFTGRTKLVNYMPYDIQIEMIATDSKEASEYILSDSEVGHSFYTVTSVSYLKVGIPMAPSDLCSHIEIPDLVNMPDKSMLFEFSSSDGVILHAQICYYQESLADIIAILPLFFVRSYLPNPAVLHIETRCQKKVAVTRLQGRGNAVVLDQLSPYLTHHLTVQLNENESPFDATVPIHFSLTKTMTKSSRLSQPFPDLAKGYPYDDSDKDTEEDWAPGDGNIQARLSLHHHSLLVEVVPWCLVSNKTDLALCFISPDDNISIMQPHQVSVLHHFEGRFQIRTSDSSPSDWLTLVKNPELDHPSRTDKLNLSYVPLNGSRIVLLKTKKAILDLLLRSQFCHGIRVLSLHPRWWFVNMLKEAQNTCIKPCVSHDYKHLQSRDFVCEAPSSTPVPLLHWGLEVEKLADASSKDNGNSQAEDTDGSVLSSVDETSSSFLCVGQDVPSTSVLSMFVNRSVCIETAGLTAVVSVKDQFARKLVEFCKPPDYVLAKQKILTQHESKNMLYLMLHDIKKEKYILHNQCSTTFYIREVSDKSGEPLCVIISPNQCVKYESFMDSEAFPRCMRMYRSIKMEICEEGSTQWTEFLITAGPKPYEDELLLFDARLIAIRETFEEGSVHVWFQEDKNGHKEAAHQQTQKYCCTMNIRELKIVLLDDCTRPLLSYDVLHVSMNRISIQLSRKTNTFEWAADLTLSDLQIDNQLFANTEFPVLLTSCNSGNKCVSISAIFTKSFQLNTVEMGIEPLELQIDGGFAQALSRLLQSYLESAYIPIENKRSHDLIPHNVLSEAQALSNPLRFQSLSINPITLVLTIRASVKLQVSVHRGAVSLSKFSCKDVDTTVNELAQEMSRHYFADAVFGAGWVIGSLDLLGNPASTIRSFVQGLSDFVVLPYEGLMNGPTAFIGGFTRGFSSLLRHFSSGALRSVTNIASGISRNLDPTSYEEPNLLALPSASGDVGTLNISNPPVSQRQGYISGVTKALVGVVTKPIGGAASIVSKTGETILRKAGLEERKSVRYKNLSHASNNYHNSLTKYKNKVLTSPIIMVTPLFALNNCHMVIPNGVEFAADLVLTSTDLHIIRVDDDSLETTLQIADIDLNLSEDLTITICQDKTLPVDKSSVYAEKVADYLGVNARDKTLECVDVMDVVKCTVKVQSALEAKLFQNTFVVAKSKRNRFEW